MVHELSPAYKKVPKMCELEHDLSWCRYLWTENSPWVILTAVGFFFIPLGVYVTAVGFNLAG